MERVQDATPHWLTSGLYLIDTANAVKTAVPCDGKILHSANLSSSFGSVASDSTGVKATLTFFLPRGSYATMLIKRLALP